MIGFVWKHYNLTENRKIIVKKGKIQIELAKFLTKKAKKIRIFNTVTPHKKKISFDYLRKNNRNDEMLVDQVTFDVIK